MYNDAKKQQTRNINVIIMSRRIIDGALASLLRYNWVMLFPGIFI